MKKINSNIFTLYFINILFGPLVYIGKIPISSYHLIFIVLLYFLTFFIIYNEIKIRVFNFMIFFIFTMAFYTFMYAFKWFDFSYIHNFRDLIIIYSGFQYIVLIIILNEVIEYKNLTTLLIKINLYIIPVMGVIAILQLFNILGVPNILADFYSKIGSENRMEYLSFNPRATATFNLEPNTFGLYMSFSLLMFHMFYKDLRIKRLSALCIFSFGIIGLLLSGSFTGVIIYIFTTSIYLVIYKKIGIKLIIGISLSIIILTTFFYEDIERSLNRQKITVDNYIPSSLKHRFEERWQNVFIDFKKNYMIGIGPAAVQLKYSTDNEYLDKFLRYGLLGGVVFIGFIIFLILSPWMKIKTTNDKFIRKLFVYSSLLAVAFALASLTGTAFKAKRVAELFWIYYSLPFINLMIIGKSSNNFISTKDYSRSTKIS